MARQPQDFALVVDATVATPVYIQIARQIREAIAAGTVAPGMRLPSVRALAADLGFNLNTVARAYRLLEEEGFVAIEDRSAARALAPGASGTRELRQGLKDELRVLVARMRQAGFERDELRRLALAEIAALAGRGGT